MTINLSNYQRYRRATWVFVALLLIGILIPALHGFLPAHDENHCEICLYYCGKISYINPPQIYIFELILLLILAFFVPELYSFEYIRYIKSRSPPLL